MTDQPLTLETPATDGRRPDGTFAPGGPGGPGRGKGNRGKLAKALDELADADARTIYEVIATAAKGGDLQAARVVLDRAWPAPKSRPVEVEIGPINGIEDLPKAQAQLLAAVASGEVSPAEAQEIGTVLDLYRRSVETMELEKRLAALEARRT